MRLLNILPYSFFDWCESMPLGNFVKQAMWAFATIETVHIMALTVLLGTMVVIDLRLLGIGLKRMPATELAGLLSPWFWASFVTMIVSGICLFAAEAVHLSTSGSFAYKMMFVLLAVAVHLTIHRRVIANGEDGAWMGKAAACLSLICWLGIGLAGRAIAFL
jgi:hypothetical protein